MADILHSSQSGENIHTPFRAIQETDPGTIGAYKAWLKVSANEVRIRNAADDGWYGPWTAGAGGGGGAAAADVTIADASDYYTSTHVEGALQEVGADLNSWILGSYDPPWVKTGAGVLYAAWADGDPIIGDDYHRTNRFVNLTPSNIGSGTQARGVRFRLPVDLAVSAVHVFGVGSTSGVGYTVAIYPVGTGSNKIWDNNGIAFTPAAVGWIAMTGATPFSLTKDTDYWMCISNTGAGAAPGVFTPQTYNNISTYLSAGPLAERGDAGIPNIKLFTLAGSGAFPATLPAASAPGSITGTVPIFFLEGTGS